LNKYFREEVQLQLNLLTSQFKLDQLNQVELLVLLLVQQVLLLVLGQGLLVIVLRRVLLRQLRYLIEILEQVQIYLIYPLNFS
jgi:hypothetical protein